MTNPSLIMNDTAKTRVWVEVKLYTFLALALDRNE